MRASLAPLARIEATATAIAAGDLSRRIDEPAGNTEVGRQAEALDVMLASIETAYLGRADGEAHALGPSNACAASSRMPATNCAPR